MVSVITIIFFLYVLVSIYIAVGNMAAAMLMTRSSYWNRPEWESVYRSRARKAFIWPYNLARGKRL